MCRPLNAKYHSHGTHTGEENGYVIYMNGYIEKNDKSKSEKITNQELEHLKTLSTQIDNSNFETNESWIIEGFQYMEIYNLNKSEWVLLCKRSGSESIQNSSEIYTEILELTVKLYNKYLYTESK